MNTRVKVVQSIGKPTKDAPIYNDIATNPIDGTNPIAYSDKIPFVNIYSYLTNLLSGPSKEYIKYYPSCSPPTFMGKEELHKMIKFTKDQYMEGYQLKDDGTLQITDKELLEATKHLFGDIFKKLTKSIFSTNMVGMSIPAKIHEPRSLLEKCLDSFRFAPLYLAKAARLSDPLERMKLVIAHSISGFLVSLTKFTPFNPLLGETLEATLSDGTKFYAEQVCHHPPVTSILLVGPNNSFTVWISYQIEGSFSGNSAEVISHSFAYVRFKDGQLIKCTIIPRGKMTGIMMGDRFFFFKGPMDFFDEKNNLKATLFFDYGEKKGITGSAKTVRKDEIEGVIYKPKGIGAPTKNAKCISELDDISTEIARISGSWLGRIDVNGVNYLVVGKEKPCLFTFANNPLPSDSRYREDLIWLRRNSIDNAEKWKDVLEIRQRIDKKLRDAHKK